MPAPAEGPAKGWGAEAVYPRHWERMAEVQPAPSRGGTSASIGARCGGPGAAGLAVSDELEERFGWGRRRHASLGAVWPPTGAGLRLDFAMPETDALLGRARSWCGSPWSWTSRRVAPRAHLRNPSWRRASRTACKNERARGGLAPRARVYCAASLSPR